MLFRGLKVRHEQGLQDEWRVLIAVRSTLLETKEYSLMPQGRVMLNIGLTDRLSNNVRWPSTPINARIYTSIVGCSTCA